MNGFTGFYWSAVVWGSLVGALPLDRTRNLCYLRGTINIGNFTVKNPEFQLTLRQNTENNQEAQEESKIRIETKTLCH